MKESNPNMLKEISVGLTRVDKQMVKEVSELGNRIRRRTAKGKAVNGTAFKPYTSNTKQSRAAQNRPVDKVYLSFNGSMLNSITAKRRSATTVALFFASQQENDKAVWHHFGTNPYTIKVKNKKVLANKKAGMIFGKSVKHPGLPSRKFFDLSKDDLAYFDSRIQKLLRRR